MRGMQPDDVYRLTGAGDPRLSPDGATVAYVQSWVDEEQHEPRSAIWCVPADGSAPPRRLTFGGLRDAPHDGRPTVAGSRSPRPETTIPPQLFVLPADGPGESRQLTALKEARRSVAWSPDSVGSRSSPEPTIRPMTSRTSRSARHAGSPGCSSGSTTRGGRRVARITSTPSDSTGAEPVQLTDGDAEDQMPAWSPDGSTIAFVSARHDDWDLRRPRATLHDRGARRRAGARDRRRTAPACCRSGRPRGTGSRTCSCRASSTTPGTGGSPSSIASTGVRTVLTEALDRNAAPFPPMRGPIWDADRIVFPCEDAGSVPLFEVPADGSGPAVPCAAPAGVLTGFDLVGDRLAYSASTPTSPPEVFVDGRQVTDVGSAFRAEVTLVGPEPFVAIAPDGVEVPAWIIRPPGFDPDQLYPAVLNIHGGPFTQYGDRFFDEFQVEAGAGYVVLYANPRGSSGYSEDWGRAIRGPVEGGPGWGSVDYDDLMAVTDEAIKRFAFIDPERIAVMGGSYGGYMTSWIIGHTDRFRVRDLGAGGQRDGFRGWLERLRRVLPRLRRREPLGGARGVSPHLAADLRRADHDPDADPALRGRPALPDQPGRAAVHRVARVAARGRVRSVPGGEPRAHPIGKPDAPGAALRAGAGLARPVPAALSPAGRGRCA